MEYTKLGKTGITVSKLCVGCMSFGKAGTMHDWTLDEAESEHHPPPLDLGRNFEEQPALPAQVRPYRAARSKTTPAGDKAVIASKGYFNPRPPFSGGHPAADRRHPQTAGHRYLGLYIIHRFDYDTPIGKPWRPCMTWSRRARCGRWALGHVRLPVLQYAAGRPRHGWTPTRPWRTTITSFTARTGGS